MEHYCICGNIIWN